MYIVGTHIFTIMGDGRADEGTINLMNVNTPAPIKEGVMPTALGDVKLTGSGGRAKSSGVTGTLDGSMLTLKFAVPPSSAKVTVDLLYGKP